MLESKIEELTSAIYLLIGALDGKEAETKAETKPKAETKKEKPPADVPAPTIAALQTRCLELTRADKANRPKIESLIASYDGKLIKDIPEDKLAEFAASLEELA